MDGETAQQPSIGKISSKHRDIPGMIPQKVMTNQGYFTPDEHQVISHSNMILFRNSEKLYCPQTSIPEQ